MPGATRACVNGVLVCEGCCHVLLLLVLSHAQRHGLAPLVGQLVADEVTAALAALGGDASAAEASSGRAAELLAPDQPHRSCKPVAAASGSWAAALSQPGAGKTQLL